jgi:predicted CDP-diglyceride synthetase/phosphatidate cytidylyltransferase
MITIDLNDLFLYLIPFVVIWVIMYKIVLKDDNKPERRSFSLLFAIVIYWGLMMTYSQINFKIQL